MGFRVWGLGVQGLGFRVQATPKPGVCIFSWEMVRAVQNGPNIGASIGRTVLLYGFL